MPDYVIVGAGSAGCVLANRLSEDTAARVLLIEAGLPDKKQEIHIPAAFAKLFKTPLDWAYETEAEPGAGGRRVYWPRGKMLGGSSSMNAMIYMRGHRSDYDNWRDLGNTGWGYRDVLPFFRRSEHQERGPSEYHGVGGPLNVADQRTINPLSHAFVEASVRAGLPRNPDFNGAEQDGAGFYQVTQKGGRRWSTAAAFLRPAMKRRNLTVVTGAQASRVLFEGTRAVGVEYIQRGQRYKVRAEREVILCGGAINSPQLLLLSGVGPTDDLRALGIDVVHDLPGVGANLQDHPAIAVTYACLKPITLAAAEQPRHIANFLARGRGPLTSNIAEAGSFVRTQSNLAAPDLQFHFAPVYFMDNGYANPPGHGFTFGAVLITPYSRGRITLRSTDPLAAPAIHAHYLTDERDVQVMVDGVKLARELVRLDPFGPYRGDEVWPGRAVQGDSAIAEFVRGRMQTLYHPAGTCKMGQDETAVVDERLRVHGLDGLRVADASIMPVVVRGNTNAPTIMIAEKAAAMIREDAVAPAARRAPRQGEAVSA